MPLCQKPKQTKSPYNTLFCIFYLLTPSGSNSFTISSSSSDFFNSYYEWVLLVVWLGCAYIWLCGLRLFCSCLNKPSFPLHALTWLQYFTVGSRMLYHLFFHSGPVRTGFLQASVRTFVVAYYNNDFSRINWFLFVGLRFSCSYAFPDYSFYLGGLWGEKFTYKYFLSQVKNMSYWHFICQPFIRH